MQTRRSAGVTKGTVATVIPIPTPVNVTTTPSPNRLRFLTPLKSHEHHTTTTPKCQKKQNVKHHCRIFGKFRIFTPPSPYDLGSGYGVFSFIFFYSRKTHVCWSPFKTSESGDVVWRAISGNTGKDVGFEARILAEFQCFSTLRKKSIDSAPTKLIELTVREKIRGKWEGEKDTEILAYQLAKHRKIALGLQSWKRNEEKEKSVDFQETLAEMIFAWIFVFLSFFRICSSTFDFLVLESPPITLTTYF